MSFSQPSFSQASGWNSTCQPPQQRPWISRPGCSFIGRYYSGGVTGGDSSNAVASSAQLGNDYASLLVDLAVDDWKRTRKRC